jgi:hypothetical protein
VAATARAKNTKLVYCLCIDSRQELRYRDNVLAQLTQMKKPARPGVQFTHPGSSLVGSWIKTRGVTGWGEGD